jgi:hypothetical protein
MIADVTAYNQTVNLSNTINYHLTANITYNMIDATTNATVSFVPIGTDVTPYDGTFDGGGYTIDNLYINQPTMSYVGLFGKTGSGAVLKNVMLESTYDDGSGVLAPIVGQNYVGGLVGENNGQIIDSYAKVPVQGNIYLGGLVGKNSVTGTISNCFVASDVPIDITGSGRGGGIAGSNEGTINSVYSNANVTLQSMSAGGLVGENINDTASITNAYAVGNVGANSNVGGLVGNNNGGLISHAYAVGNVTGQSNVGYVTGDNPVVGYTTVDVANTFGYVGQYVQGVKNGTDLTTQIGVDSLESAGWQTSVLQADFDVSDISGGDRYYPSVCMSTAASCASDVDRVPNQPQIKLPGVANLTTNLNNTTSPIYVGTLDLENGGVNQSLITSSDSVYVEYTFDDFDPSTADEVGKTFNATIDSANNFTFPQGAGRYDITYSNGSVRNGTEEMVSQTGTKPIYIFSSYTATDVNGEPAFGIAQPGEMMMLGEIVDGGLGAETINTYLFEADLIKDEAIDMSNIVPFTPIGSSGAPYNGTFDGRGIEITGVNMNGATLNPDGAQITNMGVFGYINTDAIIYNVGVSGVYTATNSESGGLVGYNNGGKIISSYAKVQISSAVGATNIGSIAGINKGVITNCYSNSTILGNASVGGLVGYNFGSILNSYFVGQVTATGSNVGGIAAFNSGVITSVYTTGQVASTQGDVIGGLLGTNTATGVISKSYTTAAVSGPRVASNVVASNLNPGNDLVIDNV